MIRSKLLSPIKRFIQSESLAGKLLFGSSVIALILANSSLSGWFFNLWESYFEISINSFELRKPVLLWVNDGLMSVFFFLIGLELKRELLVGEMNSLKKASFPIIAALGGVLVPIAFYLILNQDEATVKGWGVAMATDIAFALAILQTLGNRIPISLKIFLTAFAIIDDIAAIIIIAVFYSGDINSLYILYGLILITLAGLYFYKRGFSVPVLLLLGVVAWYFFLKSGVHPTIAGVLLAFTVPLKQRIKLQVFSKKLKHITSKISHFKKEDNKRLLDKEEIKYIDSLDDLNNQVQSPLQKLEHQLHAFVAYFVLPVFAFANAGVSLDLNYNFNTALLINIAVSLFLGKFIGVSLFSYIGIKLKLTQLPKSVSFKQIMGVAAIAGVGFTMSIFIDNLAFAGDLISINSVKVGVIIGSLLSGISGYLILRIVSPKYKSKKHKL